MKKLDGIIIGGLIVGLLIFFNYYTKKYFMDNNEIINNFNKLKQIELKLNYEILSDSVYLYRNFDEIPKLEKQVESILSLLKLLTISLLSIKYFFV